MTDPINAPTERQVLYALVAGGFIVVVAVLVAGAAVAGLVPAWWSLTSALGTLCVAAYSVVRWRNTGSVLVATIALFLIWVVGTLLVI